MRGKFKLWNLKFGAKGEHASSVTCHVARSHFHTLGHMESQNPSLLSKLTHILGVNTQFRSGKCICLVKNNNNNNKNNI